MIYRKTLVLSLLTFLCLALETSASSIYEVKRGDTLWKISFKLNLNFHELIQLNPQLKDPDWIYPGEKINVPIMEYTESPKESNQITNELLRLTNEKRKNSGLTPLTLDESLCKAAEKKALDMKQNEYVAHTSPTYGNPTVMLKDLNIPFQFVKENLGAGQQSTEDVFQAWMNSYIHRENLLDKNATHIGIGYTNGGFHGHYWTILIIKK
ncbi:CAP domain-containing protein [Cytobacillus sp. FJAT-54145]|uniref:CAP domain-containing protein n=1 Tax=Cytobacillus spartinae TaxID=3299023 RepID=A0ABW6KLE9_9BACI